MRKTLSFGAACALVLAFLPAQAAGGKYSEKDCKQFIDAVKKAQKDKDVDAAIKSEKFKSFDAKSPQRAKHGLVCVVKVWFGPGAKFVLKVWDDEKKASGRVAHVKKKHPKMDITSKSNAMMRWSKAAEKNPKFKKVLALAKKAL